MKTKTTVHFTDNYLLNPANPISVNVIGAGGTGSQVLTAMSRINQSLLSLHHPGLQVRVFDDDIVSEANLGRQLFASAEIGLNKAMVLINRLNRFFGTNWKAFPCCYSDENLSKIKGDAFANLTLTCVDTVKARFEVADILKRTQNQSQVNRHIYWLDFGNSQFTGQVILSTVQAVKQPTSKLYRPVASLPFITDEFKSLLVSQPTDDIPSCSLAEALTKQDLFINSTLANLGASLLWSLFRQGMLSNRGFFLNLQDLRLQPLKIINPKTATNELV